jgi:YhgE/Pip-like protein
MNIFKKKLFWMTPIIAIIVLALLAVAFYPAYNPKPKSMPIAIVNQDKGTSMQGNDVNIGKNFEDNITDNKKLSESVKWVKVDDPKDLQQGFEENKYYGALVLDKDLSKNALSKVQKVAQDSKVKEMKEKVESEDIPPEQAKKIQNQSNAQPVKVKQGQVDVVINKGGSMQGSQIASQMLSKVGTQLNTQISKQGVQTLEKMNVNISPSDIEGITNPVNVDTKNINDVKSHQANGNLPFLMFTPIWMVSLIASIILFMSFRSSNNVKVKDRIIASIGQFGVAILTSLISGFGYVYFMTGVLNVTIDKPNTVATYISIAVLAFISLIHGFMTWLGIKVVPLFMVLLFFSMQLLMLPKEMLPKFYQDYMISWNPFRHYAENLREIIFLGHNIELNSTMWMFIGFIIFGGISTITAAIVRKHSTKRTEVPS